MALLPLLVEAGVEQPDETGEAAPVVEVHARALGRVAPRREVLTDVAVRAPLAEEERSHLAAQAAPG